MNKPPLPEKFLARVMEEMDGGESAALVSSLDTESPVSVRFNPYKISEKPGGAQVAWSKYGYYLAERPIFTADPLFHSGAYYVQEASSMFLEQVFMQAVENGEDSLRILDLCAAPGGKTTHMASLAGLESLVVANEVIRPRANILAENVKKWGLGNVVVTNNDPKHFSALRKFFDVVVVDAPCSGEGMFRKSTDSRSEWTPANASLCAARQRRILADVWDSLREGGVLIYSTCTFNREENEENIRWLSENYDCEPIHINTPEDWWVVRDEVNGIETFRFYPHKIKGEGFFVSVLRKGGVIGRKDSPKPKKRKVADLPKNLLPEAASWFAQPEFMRFGVVGDDRVFGYYAGVYNDVNVLAEMFNVVYSGVEAGRLIGRGIKPEHTLALFHDVARDKVSEAELPLSEALKFLHKGNLSPDPFAEGLNMVTFGGLPLGWIKRIGNRCNNMYPKEWRILSEKIV